MADERPICVRCHQRLGTKYLPVCVVCWFVLDEDTTVRWIDPPDGEEHA